MGAKEIMSKKFDMGLKGYKIEEVEDYLRVVSLEFSRLQKENESLEKKLDVLADKIKEYREDEDTLKDALLGAQRQGNALIADSKRRAAEIVEAAQANSADILKKAEEGRQKLQEQGESEISAAREEAANIIDNANNQAADIELEMNLKTDVQKEILHRTTSEILNFKARVISSYKEQMVNIEKIVEECENEFIKKTLKEGKPDFKSYSSDKKNKSNTNVKGKSKTQQLSGGVEKEQKQGGVSDTANLNKGESIKFEVDADGLEDTGDISLFPAGSDGKTGDIFFKKEQASKTAEMKTKTANARSDKQELHFGGNNNK
ncbi:MAG: DivIVA domain-containing protein [Oscillospiraceae bacterium]|nr:DivIVA domain-containing protein [Oscillospiraceae bacterium]